MNQDEGDRYEQGLHDWLNSWEDRWSKESKPRQREHLIAERAMGPEPKLSEEAVQQIKKDFAFNDSIEMDGDKLPELDTDQSRLYRNEWEDWQFAKKKAKDYAVRGLPEQFSSSHRTMIWIPANKNTILVIGSLIT